MNKAGHDRHQERAPTNKPFPVVIILGSMLLAPSHSLRNEQTKASEQQGARQTHKEGMKTPKVGIRDNPNRGRTYPVVIILGSMLLAPSHSLRKASVPAGSSRMSHSFCSNSTEKGIITPPPCS